MTERVFRETDEDLAFKAKWYTSRSSSTAC